MSDILTITNTQSSSASSLSAPTRGQAEGSPALDPSDGVSGMSTVSSESRGDSITPVMEVALLTMRQNDYRVPRRIEWSIEVLEHLKRFGRATVSGADFYACAKREWAKHNGRFHVLTPEGRRQADDVAKRIAREDDLHIGGYDYHPRDRTEAPSVFCTCGMFNHHRKRRDSLRLGSDFQHHLRHVGAK